MRLDNHGNDAKALGDDRVVVRPLDRLDPPVASLVVERAVALAASFTASEDADSEELLCIAEAISKPLRGRRRILIGNR